MSLNTLKNICYFTATFTLVVISVGAWVRLTDAGLGCPDWPGCYGILSTPDTEEELLKAKELYPDSTIDIGKAWREMFHRYLAGTLGILVFFISYLTLKYAKHVPKIYPISLSILIVVQSTMGMLTVTQLVKPTIVTTHLILGMTTAGLLLWNGLQVQLNHKNTNLDFKLINLIVICTLALIFQIILGGWTSTNYAALACTDYPTCHGAMIPPMDFQNAFSIFRELGFTANGESLSLEALHAIQWVHRVGAIILSVYLVIMAISLSAFSSLRFYKNLLLIVLAFQFVIGVANLLLHLPLALATAHNLGAAFLVIILVIINSRVTPSR